MFWRTRTKHFGWLQQSILDAYNQTSWMARAKHFGWLEPNILELVIECFERWMTYLKGQPAANP